MRIALAWLYDEDTGTYMHAGNISGYASYAFFNPQGGYAGIVLANQGMSILAGFCRCTSSSGSRANRRFRSRR
jgi:hypothetical protein